MTTPHWRLAQADTTLKCFLTAFLLLLTVGYATGLVFVNHTTSGTPQGLAEQFRGTPEGMEQSELKYAKSPDEMSVLLHNHILSLSLVFLAVGGLFYFSSAPEGWKRFLLVEPFVAIGTTFGGIALMRFVWAGFSWVVLLSGATMVACYAVMVGIILKELWWQR